MEDDRLDFANKQAEFCKMMGKDEKLFNRNLDFLLELEKYRYSYLWNWFGAPIIQMPADIMATQEVIFKTKPDVIIETGVARGGSVIFLAALQKLLGDGIVIGVDIDIRQHNRETIETSVVSERIKLIEGPSTDVGVLEKVSSNIPHNSSVMVILDSDHSRQHVLNECLAYSEFVTKGQYLVVADTLMGFYAKNDAPKERSMHWYAGNEPLSAISDFFDLNSDFVVDPEINGKLVISSSPRGYLRRDKY